ncbi:MAG: ATP-binding cassette domain-containing protein [Bacteroidota bacterium]|nr:ATP-binding cassette domain-containing protein [Bacteroidota bacterium]
MSIKVENICKSYDNYKAVNNISFELKKGEILGLLGPNGAGKSTLIKIITGYLKQDKGDVIVCNMNTLKDNLMIKREIGYLAENNPLYLDMFITEYLGFIADIYHLRNKRERIIDVMKKTGITDEKRKKIRMLSKGYKQRVGIAAALIHDPDILILDEPTSGLDPNQLLDIRNLIKSVGKNKTVLLSTHIMQEVDKICSRIIVMNKGEIVDDSSINDIQKNNINLEKHFFSLTQ